MKLTVDTKEFASAIAWVNRVIPTSASHPVLSYIKLSAEREENWSLFLIQGTNLSIYLSRDIEAKIERPGDILVPSKLLVDLVSQLPQGELSLEVIEKTAIDGLEYLELSIGKLTYELPTRRASEYPDISAMFSTDAESIKVESGKLKMAIASVLYAAHPEEIKGIITGVCFNFESEQIEFATTDGHRLAISRCLEVDGIVLGTEEIVLHANGLKLLLPVLLESPYVDIQADKVNTSFCVLGHKLTLRNLAGVYPSYKKLIPTDYVEKFACDRKLLIQCCNRMELVAANSNVEFICDAKSQRMNITPSQALFGRGTEEIPIENCLEDLDFLLNITYLAEALKQVEGDFVFFSFSLSSPLIRLSSATKISQHYLLPLSKVN